MSDMENWGGNVTLAGQSVFAVGGSLTACGYSFIRGVKTFNRNKVSSVLSFCAGTLHGSASVCYISSSLIGKLVGTPVLVTSSVAGSLEKIAQRIDDVAKVADSVNKG